MAKDSKKIKRIGIDARFYGPVGKGLGRYTQEIIDNVIKIDEVNEYVIFLSEENFDEFSSENKKVKKVLTPIKWYTAAEQIMFPYYILRERLDLMHFPHFNVPILTPVKFVVTIHDLILTKFPTARATTLGPLTYKIKNWGYKIVIWLAVKRAKAIIAVSNFTKNDVIKRFKIDGKKVIVTYEGVANLAKGRDTIFTKKIDDKKTLLGYNIDKPFLLYVGNAYPHKNLEGLIRVYNKIRQSKTNDITDIRLVLVGKEDYFYKRVENYAHKLGLWNKNQVENSSSPIVFPGYVPDTELETLYKKALVYVFPSFYEGFGLPPLEAMAKGAAVVSSNKSSLPEILGEAAIYFNPENENEMQKQIERVINNEELRQDLIKKGYGQVKKYSWWECARETCEVYNKVL